MKILLMTDGSSYTKRMLAYLAAHDEWLGDRHDYTVLHVVPFVPARASAMLPRSVVQNYYRDEADKVLNPVRSFFARQGLNASFVAKSGNVAQVASKMADEHGFDLIMMGSHGHGNLGNLIMGSVATRVLAHTKLPVLLVR